MITRQAYEVLQKVSNSKESRMAYETRQAEIMDQLTREESAKESGREEGIDEGILLTKKVLKLSTEGYTTSQIAKECKISENKVKNILE